MESPFAREQDYAFASFDARAREASERADLRDALAGMKGSRRMTRRELGPAKVWYPSAIVGPAAPCSKCGSIGEAQDRSRPGREREATVAAD